MERATRILSADGQGAERSAHRQPARQHPDARFQCGDFPVRLPLQALTHADGLWTARFQAMGGPCEVLVETEDAATARDVADTVAACAWRIERKFSRYRSDNIVARINAAEGAPVEVDAETADLLDFAGLMHQLSNGLFDITSGVLRRAWSFDGVDRFPARAEIDALLPLVGWTKVQWSRPVITLFPGMQIDFGGIGKEYAVDQAATMAKHMTDAAVLVNFGGDLAVTYARKGDRPWRVAIEGIDGRTGQAAKLIELTAGAMATSGDTYRFIT